MNISHALKLDEDERKHLFELANVDPAIAGAAPSRRRPDAGFLQAIVDQLRYPSFVTDEATDLIAWNRSAELIVADFGSMPESERYMMNIMFTHADYRRKLVNWEAYARYSTAMLRATLDRYKHNPLYMERFEKLKRESEIFGKYWELYEIKQKRAATAIFRLPDEQEMEFVIHSASVIDNDPGLHWCIYVPVPGTGTEERLLRMLEQNQ